MEEKDEKFSWTLLFFVTAASFLIFSALTRLLDGPPSHYSLFFKISIGVLILAILSFFIELISKPETENEKRHSSPE